MSRPTKFELNLITVTMYLQMGRSGSTNQEAKKWQKLSGAWPDVNQAGEGPKRASLLEKFELNPLGSLPE